MARILFFQYNQKCMQGAYILYTGNFSHRIMATKTAKDNVWCNNWDEEAIPYESGCSECIDCLKAVIE